MACDVEVVDEFLEEGVGGSGGFGHGGWGLRRTRVFLYCGLGRVGWLAEGGVEVSRLVFKRFGKVFDV